MSTRGEQCEACGRFPEDWSTGGKATDESGAKSEQLGIREDRTAGYRRMRLGMGLGAVTDFDQVEWRRDDSGWFPVALLELTRVDGNVPVPQSYLDAIVARFEQRDLQGDLARIGARLLGAKAWIVAFRHDLTEFWVYNLSDGGRWYSGDRAWYERQLQKMRRVPFG